jgi:peptidoglycan/LPS O-acetylase OafA/YrhL
MRNATRIRGLDGLRGLAAIAIMLFHFNLFFLPQAHVPFVGRAYLAVDLFFLLSGFVMAHVYGGLLTSDRRAHWLLFARARFARIYPLFALTTLAMFAIAAVSHLPLAWVSFSGRSLALQPFLLQQWAPGLSWDYPSWSISTEAEAYIFFVFFAGVLLAGKHPRLIVFCCVATLAVLCIARGGSLNCFTGTSALLRTLAEFSLGVLLYRAFAGGGSPRAWVAILFCALLGLGAISHFDLFVVGAFACLIYYSASATDVVGKLLNSSPLVCLGDWSYSVYLWHAPTHYAVMTSFAALNYPVSNLGLWGSRLLLLATVAGVLALSAFHYQYFETPVRRFIQRFPLGSATALSVRTGRC